MPEDAYETTCQEVHQLLKEKANLLLIDCREPDEHEIGTIEGAMLLPMSELAARHKELADRQVDHMVVYCHHGMRSLNVTRWLRQHGFPQAQSMVGGIDLWAQEVDPQMPRY